MLLPCFGSVCASCGPRTVVRGPGCHGPCSGKMYFFHLPVCSYCGPGLGLVWLLVVAGPWGWPSVFSCCGTGCFVSLAVRVANWCFCLRFASVWLLTVSASAWGCTAVIAGLLGIASGRAGVLSIALVLVWAVLLLIAAILWICRRFPNFWGTRGDCKTQPGPRQQEPAVRPPPPNLSHSTISRPTRHRKPMKNAGQPQNPNHRTCTPTDSRKKAEQKQWAWGKSVTPGRRTN